MKHDDKKAAQPHNTKALTREYLDGNAPYYIEKADLYLSEHIGQEVTIKEIRTAAYSAKSGGGLGNYIVRKALERYQCDLRYEGNTRIFTPIRRTHSIPLNFAFANGQRPISRNGRAAYNNKANENPPHTILWRRLMSDFAPYRDCITKTREEAIAWNEAHIGKNTTSDRYDWDLF